MNNKLKIISAVIAAITLSGCAGVPLTSTRFSGASNLHPEAVQTGVVVRTMPIKINNSARVDQATGLGAGAGGIAGGIGGAMMGSTLIGAVVGAVGGGIIGDAITPGAGKGTDVFVRMDMTGQIESIPEAGVVHLYRGEKVFVITSQHGHYRVEPQNSATTSQTNRAQGTATIGAQPNMAQGTATQFNPSQPNQPQIQHGYYSVKPQSAPAVVNQPNQNPLMQNTNSLPQAPMDHYIVNGNGVQLAPNQ